MLPWIFYSRDVRFFHSGVVSMVVCVSTVHVRAIHMLAISRNVTTLTFCCPSATHKKTVHANESKPNYEYDPRMWWSVTVRHSIRVYTALSKWNQIHRSLLLGVCLCTEQNMCHVIAPSRVLRSLEPLFVCIGWLREKAEKSIVNWLTPLRYQPSPSPSILMPDTVHTTDGSIYSGWC